MTRAHLFWAASATLLFTLSLTYFHHGLQRKNPAMAAWLVGGVLSQLLFAWGLAAEYPSWMPTAGRLTEWLSVLMAAAVVATAAARWGCPVNRSLALAMGGMLAANLTCQYLSYKESQELEAWLRNISFFGPALYLLFVFGGLRMDKLPLYISRLICAAPRVAAIMGHARSILG